MGIRTILIVLALWGLYWVFRNILNKKEKSKLNKPPEDMVQCHYCDDHLPISEAVKHVDEYYCCEQHLQKYLKNNEKN